MSVAPESGQNRNADITFGTYSFTRALRARN
jgi:hypothetical protein